MTAQLQHIVQKIFSKDSLEEVSLEELQQVVNKYPYFSIGHLLLSQKQKRLSTNNHHEIARTTSLYFQDPLWLQWLLDEETGYRSQETGDKIQETGDFYEQEQESTRIENVEATIVHEQENVEEIEEDEKEIITEDISEEVNIESAESRSTASPDSSLLSPDSLDLQFNDSTLQKLREAADQKVEDTTAPLFEPYHTIDYFASQGIKISNEIKSDDKFGQQLKSFTEWLKTMKRFPQPKADEEVNEIEKSHIREIAEHSLEGKEVVTEAMAEVLVKQHRTEEAKHVYEKLSLLNPSKSAYFAAKIEQLKEN